MDRFAPNSLLPAALVTGVDDEATARNIAAARIMTGFRKVSIEHAPSPGPAVRPGSSPKGARRGRQDATPACFTFETHRIRTVTVKGAPWFIAADACQAIGLSPHKRNYAEHLTKLDADEVCLVSDTGQKLPGTGMHLARA